MHVRQITTLFRQDLTSAMRDNLVIYMFVAPMLLALGGRFLLPSLEESKVTYAVERSIPAWMVARLDDLGDVELYDSRAQVIERVERSDDVPGIVQQEGAPDRFTVYLEGNEAGGEELATMVMGSVLAQEEVASFVHRELRAGRSLLGEYGAVVLVMLAVMIGALVMGFLMVDDKETNVIQAFAVSPLTVSHYLMARALFAITFSTATALLSTFVLVGTSVNYALMVVGFIIAAAVGLIIGYVIGGFTRNQMEAMGMIKIVMFAYLTIPILSVFVSETWQWLFYLLPNFWMFKVFENLFVGQTDAAGFWMACALTLLSSAVYLAVLAPMLRERVQLRFA